MSNDTQVKQEAPGRIWIDALLITTPSMRVLYGEPPPDGAVSVEYVRADLLATVRKEEQEAAFKLLCPDCAEGDTPTFDQKARWCYHGEGSQEVGCSASKLRIAALEASATDKEGMNG